MSKNYTPDSAAQDVEAAFRLLEGRWKLVILFHLFGGKVLRFSDLERAIPNITQKMLGQQLRRMESDGIVVRKVYPQVPPKVEYSLTTWGQALCPALDAILMWADLRQQPSVEHIHPLPTNRGDSAVSEVIAVDDLRASGTTKAVNRSLECPETTHRSQ